MYRPSFEKPKRKKSCASRQAMSFEEAAAQESRRHFLKSTGLLVAGAMVGGLGTREIFKKVAELSQGNNPTKITENSNDTSNAQGEKSTTKNTSENISHSADEAESEVTKENSVLDAYSFLDGKVNPVEISTNELAGKTFSNLYATYLGIPSGTVVPKTLHVDFKENLASLWREKFNIQSRSSDKRVTYDQLQFLKEHHSLMNLAEYLYRSYEVQKYDTMTLDAYHKDVTHSVDTSRRVFSEAFAHKMNEGFEKGGFSKEQLSLISDMGKSLTAYTFLSISFTELMPSTDGRTNAQVFDFLLRHAGIDFINRIPSVHDMLESFGPYQITSEVLSSRSVGSWAVKVLNMLPNNFMPSNVGELLRGKENVAAYTLAMLHIAQFVGTRNNAQLRCLSKVMHTLPLTQRTQAIFSFVASSHHRPQEAYESFDEFIWSMYIKHAHSFSEEDILRHIPKGDLRIYTQKALANNKFLMANNHT